MASESQISEPQDWRILNTLMKDKLKHLFETGLFSDIEIKLPRNTTPVVGGSASTKRKRKKIELKNENEMEIIKCHSWLLKMVSPVFESMLSGNFHEKDSILIEDADADMFKIFIKHIYIETTDCNSIEEAWEVYGFATKYMIAAIQKRCLDYISKKHEYETACLNYNFADFYDLQEIREQNYETILENMKNVMTHDSFKSLSEKCISRIVDEETLYVSEGFLFEKLAQWIHLNAESKTRLVNSLISKIRFSEMTVEEFAKHVGSSTLLPEDIRLKIMMYLTLRNYYPHPSSVVKYIKTYPHRRYIILRKVINDCLHSPSVAEYIKTYPRRRYRDYLNCSCQKTSVCSLSSRTAITKVKFEAGAVVLLDRGLKYGETLSFHFKMNSKQSNTAITLLQLKNAQGYSMNIRVESNCLKITSESGRVTTFSKCLYDGNTHSLKLQYTSTSFPCYLDNKTLTVYSSYGYSFTEIIFGPENNSLFTPGINFCIHDVKVGSHPIQFQQNHRRISQLRECRSC